MGSPAAGLGASSAQGFAPTLAGDLAEDLAAHLARGSGKMSLGSTFMADDAKETTNTWHYFAWWTDKAFAAQCTGSTHANKPIQKTKEKRQNDGSLAPLPLRGICKGDYCPDKMMWREDELDRTPGSAFCLHVAVAPGWVQIQPPIQLTSHWQGKEILYIRHVSAERGRNCPMPPGYAAGSHRHKKKDWRVCTQLLAGLCLC